MSYSSVGCGANGCFGTVAETNGSSPNGAMPGTPAACADKEKVKEMLVAAGYAPPPPTGDEFADSIAMLEKIAEFAQANDITVEELKSESPEVQKKLCDALVKASGGAPTNGELVPVNGNGDGWWSQQSTGVKVAIGVGGVAAVGAVAYFALK